MYKKNKRGFTLIELLVSISIISIISICFFNIINNSLKINKKNEVDIKAMNIAQTAIEDIRNDIKEGNIIGLDMDEDGEDEFNIIDSNWNGTLKEIYVQSPSLTTTKSIKNIEYEVNITKLERERYSNSSTKYLYTIKLVVKQVNKDYKGVEIETQIFAS